MGVQSLWDLLLPTAKRITLEDLRGQILAIDASIWMVKVQAIYSHVDQMLLSIFNKIIMLLRYGIRPVFVFDGLTLDLKKNTLEKRRRSMLQTSDNQIRRKAQLEIIRLLKNKPEGGKDVPTKQSTQEARKPAEELATEEEQLSEIELMKLEMYSERLNDQYALLMESYNNLENGYSYETFCTLTIAQREQIIKSIKERANYHRNEMIRQQRSQRDNEKSYRELFMQDLNKIKNNAILTKKRNEQYHQLINKVDQSKGADGTELAKGTYQGSVFEMRRKEPEKKEYFEDRRRRYTDAPTKNNFAQILRKKDQEEEEPQELPKPAIQEKTEDPLPPTNEEIGLANLKIVQQKPSATQIQSDSEGFVFEEEEHTHVTLKLDIEKLKQIARLSTSASSEGPTTESVVEVPAQQAPKADASDELPPHVTDYSAPMPEVFVDNIQVKQLLDLMGLPYVNAPYEAEAQCAQLQHKGLVEGVVTEDSDIFLFGGSHVYRGVFQNDVKFYSIDRVRKELGMNRLKCILFAMFLGSDYTEGVKGIGIVNAMEILRVFDTVQKVQRLRQWARLPDQLVEYHSYKGCTSEEIEFFEFHKNFKKYWYMEDDFPNTVVVNEYLSPHVEDVSSPFKFSQPDLGTLSRLLTGKFKMREQEAKPLLDIVGRTYRQYSQQRQTKIKEYMTRPDDGPCAIIKSKRLMKALPKDSEQ